MAFFKKIVNKFNKKESLNIEHQFETTNNLKEIDNEFEVNGKDPYTSSKRKLLVSNWQNFESNGWNNIEQEPASSNWMNEEPSSSTNTDETFFHKKTPSVSIEQEILLLLKRVVENMILDLIAGQLKIYEIETIKVCLVGGNFFTLDNCRLYAFQTAIKLGLKVKKIPVKIVRIEDSNLLWKLEELYAFQTAIKLGLKVKKIPVKIVRIEDSNLLWKLEESKIIIQNTNFSSIIVSEYARNNVVINKDGFWKYR
ncbi:hypothetical protein C2G38_2221892 [Gigaspora rosea]|uniref:Uncharacterized protein n=1 Tax=Gigaspora rosea TaxID=44941 RepID=A0A397U313_9GLOM|nr:hypothetical protein C2G38_2221892 [Gigaspora rosea]